jgi:hypothetical protein
MQMGYDADQAAADIVKEAVVHLPDGDLAVGATWTNQATLPDPFTGGLTLDVSYTYNGQETINGYDCARVSFSLTVQSVPQPFTHTVNVGGFAVDTQVDLKATGSGTFYLAVSEGILVNYQSNLTINSMQTATMEVRGERTTDRYSSNATINETFDLTEYTTN